MFLNTTGERMGNYAFRERFDRCVAKAALDSEIVTLHKT